MTAFWTFIPITRDRRVGTAIEYRDKPETELKELPAKRCDSVPAHAVAGHRQANLFVELLYLGHFRESLVTSSFERVQVRDVESEFSGLCPGSFRLQDILGIILRLGQMKVSGGTWRLGYDYFE